MVSNDIFKKEDTFDRIIREAMEQTEIDMKALEIEKENNKQG